jgi:hypothetical protein
MTGGLWLTIDGKHVLDVYAFVENVVRVTRKAIHKIEDPPYETIS